ncbi:innexin inx5 [Drosophila sulfurigaster albostrigata]|uniref:innexin inx5 n=1 Tax=Drosophila sulfurigaster albostrigata TaxID=89887 RepID=UPI002D219A1C|nr:innexin inx5 [Drosophila sulfurigaster albostrigata]
MYTAVKPLSKYLQLKSVRIYDGIFTLHAKCTCAILLAFTFLLSSKQYFGDPVVCISGIPQKDFVVSHCWTMGMYIMDYEDGPSVANLTKEIQYGYSRQYYNQSLEKNLLNNVLGLKNENGRERIFLRYYQWVVPVLLLQSFIFYLPAFLWKKWEGGRLKNLCANLEDTLTLTEKTNKHLSRLAFYFSQDHKESHLHYFVCYTFCEVLNFIISICNIKLLNVFLVDFWSHYIKAVAAVPAYNWDEWNRITTRIFPKIAKCQILKFGGSGSLEYHDNLCLLPLNTLNEKIFVFLWFWFILMAFLAALKLIYRSVYICNRGLRLQVLRAQTRFMSKATIWHAVSGFSCGDWFFLMRVSSNISPEHFGQLMRMVCGKRSGIEKSGSHNIDTS